VPRRSDLSAGFQSDPHSEPGSACPRNVFGLTDYAELSRIERAFGINRLGELAETPLIGNFDIAHLQSIHRYLFQDIFPWAGELRLVVMSKVGGAPFAYPAYPAYIAPALTELLKELKSEDCLRHLDAKVFAQRAGYYLGEINAIHPFREGNGRTQREFIRQLGQQAGHALSWAGISEDENTAASIAAHTRKDYRGLATIIQRAFERAEDSNKG
jgi:cell filamentation protein